MSNVHYNNRLTNEVGEKYHSVKYVGSSEERVYQNGIPESYLVRQDIYDGFSTVPIYNVCGSTDDLFEFLSIEYHMTEYETATAIIDGTITRVSPSVTHPIVTTIEILHLMPVGLVVLSQ